MEDSSVQRNKVGCEKWGFESERNVFGFPGGQYGWFHNQIFVSF
jgi:hypothetical protein